jgi:hypothetical protein
MPGGLFAPSQLIQGTTVASQLHSNQHATGATAAPAPLLPYAPFVATSCCCCCCCCRTAGSTSNTANAPDSSCTHLMKYDLTPPQLLLLLLLLLRTSSTQSWPTDTSTCLPESGRVMLTVVPLSVDASNSACSSQHSTAHMTSKHSTAQHSWCYDSNQKCTQQEISTLCTAFSPCAPAPVWRLTETNRTLLYVEQHPPTHPPTPQPSAAAPVAQ